MVLLLFIFKDLFEFVFGSGILAHHTTGGFFNDVFGEADADAAVDFVVEFESLTFLSFKDFGDGAESNLILGDWITRNPDGLFKLDHIILYRVR